MALKGGKLSNQYDFSNGINISQPGYLIDPTECYANPHTYDGTKNCYWDTGIKKRLGTLKINGDSLPASVINGIRHYRSVAPTKTTIVAVGDTDEVKIYYLDTGDTFVEITSGSTIPTGNEVYFTSWHDKVFCANGDTVLQVISHNGDSWIKSDITGLTYMPQYVVQHRDRLWVAGGDMPDGYFECSDYGSESLWEGTVDEMAFYAGYKDGDPITQLAPLAGSLAVYKNDSIWIMKGDNLHNWFQETEEDSKGCVAPGSVADVGFGHIFLSIDNIYFFTGKDLTPIGNKIKPWLDAIPANLRKKAVATYHNNYYRIAFASANSSYNDMELILDLKYFQQGKISWWLNEGRDISAYINYDGPDENTVDTLYMCDSNDGFIRKMETGTQDDGDSICMEFHSKYFIFEEPNREKNYDRLKIDHSIGIGNLYAYIIKNLNDAYTLPVVIDASGLYSSFGNAVLGTTYWTNQENTRQTAEIALPSEMDGYSISYKITHAGNYENVRFYGFTIAYKYKSY